MDPACSDNTNDALLLRQIAEGNVRSFEVLYEHNWESVYQDAYKRLKDRDLSKDIVQEIFTHLWVKRETLIIENLPAYLKIATRNQVFKFLARQKITHSFFDHLEQLPATSLHPDARLLWDEFLSSYEALLQTMSPAKQKIFRMRFDEELSSTDIANRLGLSRKTVQNQIGRALEQLKVSLFYLFAMIFLLID